VSGFERNGADEVHDSFLLEQFDRAIRLNLLSEFKFQLAVLIIIPKASFSRKSCSIILVVTEWR